MLTLFFCVLIAALAFEYINGFHDAANAIATVVSTKVLTPRQAIVLAATCNLVGAFWGTAVAKAVWKDFVDPHAASMTMVLAGLIAAIIWNLLTWWWGLPSSSSHALVGGLCGAAVASSKGGWGALLWETGLWPKLIKPMILSPLVGFVLGAIIMLFLTWMLYRSRPSFVNNLFGKLQILSAGVMGFSHGTNDAQKTMGIITLALVTGTQAHAFDELPAVMSFLRVDGSTIPKWVIAVCAVTMFAGTAGGGWRIIKTMGHKMVKLMPVHGFAAETTAATVIMYASHHGIPISTTHVISTSIMGVGATRRLSAVKWGIVGRIVWAWVLTLPITGFLGFWAMKLFSTLGVTL